MGKSVVELDFFKMEKENSNVSSSNRLYDRRRSFRGVISKLNPELLKTVIGSGGSFMDQTSDVERSSIDINESVSKTAPLTIFYNGTISVFHLHKEKAHDILKMAEKQSLNQLADGDLPMTRRKSLQTFMALRHKRVSLSSPYFRDGKDTSSRF